MHYVFIARQAGNVWEVIRHELATGRETGGYGAGRTYEEVREMIRRFPDDWRFG